MKHTQCTWKITYHQKNETYLPDDPTDLLSLILFRYSDGLIKWLEPSKEFPLGKLGGTNGSTSCLFTKFGPPGREFGRSYGVYVWLSSTVDSLPWCSADNVPLISLAFLFAEMKHAVGVLLLVLVGNFI